MSARAKAIGALNEVRAQLGLPPKDYAAKLDEQGRVRWNKYQAKYARKSYRESARHGVCVKCSSPAEAERRYCRPHLLQERARSAARRVSP